MSYTNKENVTSQKPDLYRGNPHQIIHSPLQDSAKYPSNTASPQSHPSLSRPEPTISKPHSVYQNYKPSQPANDLNKPIAYVLSPNRDNSKFINPDELSLQKTPSENADLNNSAQLSTFSANESAQKQLNYSRTTVSFRQVTYFRFFLYLPDFEPQSLGILIFGHRFTH
jgi:hypothetical protein